MIKTRDVKRILEKYTKISGWKVKTAEHGISKETFIAENGEYKVLVKFDASNPALSRLSEIGVAPPLIAEGRYENRDFIIQEYLEGHYPNWRWFTNNIPELADFIRTYHKDFQLKKILTRTRSNIYEQHVSAGIEELEEQAATESVNEEILSGLEKLKQQSKLLKPTELVPVHADPNFKNFIISNDEQIYMVDWDDVLLSDPLRDSGLILWWYISQDRWSEFFSEYGMEENESLYDRHYWWTAFSSLKIALWFAQREEKQAYEYYAEDFIAALNRKPNPHAKFD